MTTFSDASCPEPAVLGAYIDGTLDPGRVEDVTRHVTRCATCRVAIENVVEAWDEELPVPRPRFGSRVRWIAAVAAALIVALLVFVRRDPRPAPQFDPIAQLVAAAPVSARSIEPRLSGGFRWAPFRGTRRTHAAPKSHEELVASGAAGDVLRELGETRTPQSLHAAGVAYLIAGDATLAVKLLTDASRQAGGNARVWSDLSAALYTEAAGDDAGARRALAAAERAVRLNPRLAEAHFNRAVALEAVGTPQQVRAAWSDYVERFPAEPWTVEARERLARRERP